MRYVVCTASKIDKNPSKMRLYNHCIWCPLQSQRKRYRFELDKKKPDIKISLPPTSRARRSLRFSVLQVRRTCFLEVLLVCDKCSGC